MTKKNQFFKNLIRKEVRFCFSYTKLNLNMISFVFSIVITIIGGVIINSHDNVNINTRIEEYHENTNEIIAISEFEDSNTISQNLVEDKSIWQLEIPKINLIASISEGTNTEILDEYIGHFEETSKDNGNIVLAAHNRGYKVNYFEKVKELEIGDEVIYTYNGNRRIYVINYKTIIKDTDWENLKNTEENRITLITCVENEPEYRRCVQAIEI